MALDNICNDIYMVDSPLKLVEDVVSSDMYISQPVDEIDLFCSETVEDLDQVWEEGGDEGRADIFKTKPYQTRPLARRKHIDFSQDQAHEISEKEYEVGDSPEENPYISYLVKQFNPDLEQIDHNALDTSSSDSELDFSENHDDSISDLPYVEPVKPPSPLLERLTMVDSFNEASMNDVIIFRDDSLTPYMERSPRSSPSFDGSRSDRGSPTSIRSLSPFGDHVVPALGEDSRIRIMRSCDSSDDHIVPEFVNFIEE